MNANTHLPTIPYRRQKHKCKPGRIGSIARRTLLKTLAGITHGQITLFDNGERYCFGAVTEKLPVSADITVIDQRFYSDVLYGGSIGAGESYMAGFWYSDDLVALMRIMAYNLDIVDDLEGGLAGLKTPLRKCLHWMNRNTETGSKRNIAAHYDIGNDFFGLMLDETMMYSCAIFQDEEMSLHNAQLHRLKVICEKLDLQPDDHLLEIGSGWGALALYAAKNHGCKVTTTTISKEQYDRVCRRVKAEGLQDRVSVLMTDYRKLSGTYDKLVSIEMIEAIGHEHYAGYFQKCAALLKPEGMMLLQTITIADQRYSQSRRSVDFIQRYIFPGGCLPSVTRMMNEITGNTDMRLFHLEDIGPHYATTLSRWRANIRENLEKIRSLGYSNTFLRMWDFYLCYCQGGFMERRIGTVQMLLTKTENRRISL